MLKRVLIIYFIILVGIFIGVYRLYYWSFNEKVMAVASQNSTYNLKISSCRGNIYDCNKLPLVNEGTDVFCAVFPSVDICNELSKVLSFEEILSYVPNLNTGKPFCIKLKKENLNAKNLVNLRIFEMPVRYKKESIAAHLLGYLNQSGDGISGIEKSFNEHLKNYTGDLNISYRTDAIGRLLPYGSINVINTLYKHKGGVVLTINKEIQKIVHNIAKESLKKGAIIVAEVPSCKIRALVSMPEFDPQNIKESLEKEDSPFLNRAFESYNAGSVYKLVTAMALLENNNITGLENYNCEGSISFGNACFHCANCKAHGTEDLSKALSNSCNTYFINFFKNLNKEKFYSLNENLGFGKSNVFSLGYETSKGMIPSVKELEDPLNMAYTSFGQGTLMVTPVQVAGLLNTIATGGVYSEPKLVEGLVDQSLNFIEKLDRPFIKKVVSKETTKLIKAGMIQCIESGTGILGKPKNIKAAAKTSTAQTGIMVDGRNILQGWFAGFYPAENPKYCIVVLEEDVLSGGTDCGPIFKKVIEEISK